MAITPGEYSVFLSGIQRDDCDALFLCLVTAGQGNAESGVFENAVGLFLGFHDLEGVGGVDQPVVDEAVFGCDDLVQSRDDIMQLHPGVVQLEPQDM